MFIFLLQLSNLFLFFSFFFVNKGLILFLVARHFQFKSLFCVVLVGRTFFFAKNYNFQIYFFQYTQAVISTIQNADGTVSLFQMDPNNPIITLPDGTTAQVQGVATVSYIKTFLLTRSVLSVCLSVHSLKRTYFVGT